MRSFLASLVIVLLPLTATRGAEIDFLEDFALAPDRTVPLKQLIPGTDEHYYYHALHYLNTQQYDQARALLAPWLKRHDRTPRLQEIETRLAILSYRQNPAQSLEYLRNRLGLQFNHQREVLGAEPQLPVSLDQAAITRDAFLQRVYAVTSNLDGIEDSALDWLVRAPLTPDRRRHLLQRLTRPDHAGLEKLIVDDLNHIDSPGFGAFGIHRQLLLPQLEELLKLKPDLLNQGPFVLTYLVRLQPAPDDDWRHDADVREAYLERLQAFVSRLASVHNSLQAHVLYHRLAADQARGVHNKARFLAYLKLPRPQPYMRQQYLELPEHRGVPVDLNADYTAQTLLPPVRNDEPLVRGYLAHFLVDAADYKEFAAYVDNTYLQHLFAETKIVNGLGEPEQWASQLSPELFRQLRERVDLDFVPTNRTEFAANDPVRLDLHVKNVSTLIVKVFEINAETYYRGELREIDTDINLDGLVANSEQTYKYDDSPFRRMARKFEFPQLAKPGVYVVDFIGNGRSSRALIRKGRLRHVVRTTPGGQRFTVLDQRNQKLEGARIWLEGHEYTADKDGTVLVPFSTDPQRRSIVLSHGGIATLDAFQHEAESYSLAAGIYVDRESLLTRKKSKVVLRLGVFLNGIPVSTKVLQEVRLFIASRDHDGIASSQEVPNLEVFEDRETVQEIQVPARLASIQFTVQAKIQSKSLGKKVDVSAGDAFALNEIDRTEKIEDLHLARHGAQYFVEVLGRTGEPKASRPVQLSLKHRDFQRPLPTTLKTDPQGRIALGELKEISHVTATGPEGTAHTWVLPTDRHTWPGSLHGRVGETLTLPYLGQEAQPDRGELSLLELRGDSFVADRFTALAIKDGLLQISGLPAGDYDLWVKRQHARIRVRVVAGQQDGRYILGTLRQLEAPLLPRLQIAAVTVAPDNVTIQLRNASKMTRVHLFATRYLPAYSAFERLARVRGAEPYMFTPSRVASVFVTGRNIGDEYRYILDRKYAQKFPGNMLERPSLLLNPWAVRSTQTGRVTAEAGDAFAPKSEPAPSSAEAVGKPGDAGGTAGDFADLDFLADAAAVIVNLEADEKGVVTVPLAVLGVDRHQHLHVVAVDTLHTTYRSLALPQPKAPIVDLRQAAGLDPNGHFTQQKQISVVPSGQTFTLADITTSRFESYDSVARVYQLYATLTKNPQLAEFSFILNWPKLKQEEKRTQYSKYACHELNLFLARKDPEFFQQVVRPYLANKKDKTFLDRWLLEQNLAEYLLPWKHAQLNVAERILLGRRIDAQQVHAARHVSDLFELLPPNIDEFVRLFDTAIKGQALDVSDPLSLANAVDSITELNLLVPADAPAQLGAMTGKPGPSGGGGGMGGRGGFAPPGLQVPARDEARKLAATFERAQQRQGDNGALRSKLKSRDAAKDLAPGEKLQDRAEMLYEFDNEVDGAAIRQFFRQLDPTMEWAENNYFHLPIDQQSAELITTNAFWRDFARHNPAQPFQSRNFAAASRNFTEMMLALALLDLPFESPKHDVKFDGRRMSLTAAGPLVVFHEEIKPAREAAAIASILVSQNFFRHGDRQRLENGEPVDKYVTEEFLVHTVYGCQIVVTNPTSARQKLGVLIQVPAGSIPVLNGQYTKTVFLTLEPYHTQTIEYHFYFPAAGQFAHFPVHVAKNEQPVASAAPFAFKVVLQPTRIDTESWDYVSQNGTNEQVLAFLAAHNVNALNLDKIAFRMQDKAFFEAALQLLAQRRVFQPTLWSYGVRHDVAAAVNQFLQHSDVIVNDCGGRIDSPILMIDPVARRSYEHLEYKPLVNARAHALGKRRQIVNDRFHEQYHHFLRELSYERTLSDTDLLAVTYYLLLQDRIEEALATFARVDAQEVASRLQYDYCAAYLKFFTDDAAAARAIAAKYADHPVDRWRNTFRAVMAQLDEAQGKANETVDAEDRNQQQTKLAATEPSFDFKVEARQITLDYQNLKSVRVNYYVMDVELLFSRNPFVQQFSGQFSAIRPNQTQDLALPDGQKTLKTPLPATLANKNVLVEITGGGQTKTQAYYSNALNVQTIENYGQVRVTQAATGKPVSKAYVKVYARMGDGQVRFYKDGYTDVRGRFDYASLSTDDLETAQRFSILILSDEYGATVREASPPAR